VTAHDSDPFLRNPGDATSKMRMPEGPDLTDLVLERTDAARRFQSARRRRWISTARHTLLFLGLAGLLGAAVARRVAPGLTEFQTEPAPLTQAVSGLSRETSQDLQRVRDELDLLARRPIMEPAHAPAARLPACGEKITVGVQVRCETASFLSFRIQIPSDAEARRPERDAPETGHTMGLVSYSARPTLDPRPRPDRERRDESFRGVAP